MPGCGDLGSFCAIGIPSSFARLAVRYSFDTRNLQSDVSLL